MRIYPRLFSVGFCVAVSLSLGATRHVCATDSVPSSAAVGYTPLKVANACLPDSIGFQSAYEVYQQRHKDAAWSRVLIVYLRDGGTVRAHAYCVFKVAGKLWTYDQVGGSQRAWVAPAEKGNAEKLGRLLAARSFVRAAWVDSVL